MKKTVDITPLLLFQYVVLFLLVLLLLLVSFNSLKWRMEHDTPLLYYAAFLMDQHNLMPYRDIFETSMPGTFAFHYFIGKLFGYSDFSFRLVDLVLLYVLLACTYLFMSRFGRLPAIWSVVLFGLAYLAKGQTMSLQRDYIGIIPIGIALLLIPSKVGVIVRFRRFALVGILVGLSVLIKPHLGMVLPILFGILLLFRWDTTEKSVADLLKAGTVCFISLLVPTIIALYWLANNAALMPFIDMFVNYIPMYSALTGAHENISGLYRVFYLLNAVLHFGGYGPLLLGALFAYNRFFVHVKYNKVTLLSAICLLVSLVVCAFYPAVAGKFWDYHYMPFAYFCSLSIALCLADWPQLPCRASKTKIVNTFAVAILVLTVILQSQLPAFALSAVYQIYATQEDFQPKDGRVDEIAGWLKSELQPEDTVQPLDWVGGGIQAMLLAEARIATRFINDNQFYHHVSSPYIQDLRREFISQLQHVEPRFIIEVDKDRPRVSGIDTTHEFFELREVLDNYYTVVYEGNSFLIYERIASR